MAENRRIAVLVTDGVEDVELTSPRSALLKAGYFPILIEDEAGKIIMGKHDNPFTIDEGIDSVSPDDFIALLLPGGYSPDHLREDPRYVKFTKAFMDAGKPVFAICHGPQLLITADAVKGRHMTAFKTIQVDLKFAGADVEDKTVVVDDNLVTSRTPKDLQNFNEAILKQLDGVTL